MSDTGLFLLCFGGMLFVAALVWAVIDHRKDR
jgi:hypothetical protein